MSDQNDEPGRRVFKVTGVEKTDPPAGVGGGNWYRYTIGQGESAIHGIRSGSLKSVKQHAEEYANNLNQRSVLGSSGYAARKTQK